MRELIYHIRYAFHLWTSVGDMTIRQAWEYPYDMDQGDGDPIEDAEEELYCMAMDSEAKP